MGIECGPARKEILMGSSGRRKMEGNGSTETQEEIRSHKTVTINHT